MRKATIRTKTTARLIALTRPGSVSSSTLRTAVTTRPAVFSTSERLTQFYGREGRGTPFFERRRTFEPFGTLLFAFVGFVEELHDLRIRRSVRRPFHRSALGHLGDRRTFRSRGL
jgi:hypothetical protein